MERFTENELERRVDEVLFYLWDPVGVKDHVVARAEYRSYVPAVLAAVNTGEHHAIASLLIDIQTKQMGISLNGHKLFEELAGGKVLRAVFGVFGICCKIDLKLGVKLTNTGRQ